MCVYKTVTILGRDLFHSGNITVIEQKCFIFLKPGMKAVTCCDVASGDLCFLFAWRG